MKDLTRAWNTLCNMNAIEIDDIRTEIGKEKAREFFKQKENHRRFLEFRNSGRKSYVAICNEIGIETELQKAQDAKERCPTCGSLVSVSYDKGMKRYESDLRMKYRRENKPWPPQADKKWVKQEIWINAFNSEHVPNHGFDRIKIRVEVLDE